jgi:hypothetical protein
MRLAMAPTDRKWTHAPHREALARVFERLALDEPDPELKAQRLLEAAKMRQLPRALDLKGDPRQRN